ncbi:CHASE domain-containing protein [Thiospirillum jenense]|uniref:GGDEF domain-containing protein n=1 Tax=Thiospirillum jenense TaxID=1653858 RepID=A0A839H8V0_9GAMM|nr:CHASE domain-containing protein [Thiospirillum jenense]MBB1125394.1 GGDEF domain-containing protein [Thiospirillum jenense]
MTNPLEPSKLRPWVYLLPVLLFIIGLVITTFIWQSSRVQHLAEHRTSFETLVTRIRFRIENRIQKNEQILRGVVGFFAASKHISRAEFRAYVATLDLHERYPGIQGVGFSLRIAPADLINHEQAIRAEGFPDYHVRPIGTRDVYSAIIYLEPFDWRNQRAFGYDMFSEPIRRSAMRHAWEQGQVAVSGKVRLVQETNQDVQAGFLIYVPVYQFGSIPDSIDARRNNLLGWAYSPLRVKNLMDSLLKNEYPELAQQIAITIYDGMDMTPDSLMFTSAAPTELTPHHFEEVQPIELSHHAWILHAQTLPAFDAHLYQLTVEDISIIAAGMGASFILAAFAWILLYNHGHVTRALHQTARAHNELLKSQQQLRLIFDASDVAIFLTDLNGKITQANAWMAERLRCPFGELIGSDYLSHVHPNDSESTQEWITHLLEQRQSISKLERRYCTRDGEEFWGQMSGHVISDYRQQPIGFVGVIVDITHRRNLEAHTHFLAHHDYLTGLPNRLLFAERIEQSLALARRYQRHLGLLFLDLNGFKPINDQYGHQVGDEVLREVARRLQNHIRASDTVCRQGGDEFIILVPELTAPDHLIQLQHILIDVIRQPYLIMGHALTMSVSIGQALYPQHGDTVETLLYHADAAMYRAKHAAADHYSRK